MKIISKYKDYYYHIAYQYGEDPFVVYNRQPIDNNSDIHKELIHILQCKSIYVPEIRSYNNEDGHYFKWLVVNAKLYLLHTTNIAKPYKVLTVEQHQILFSRYSSNRRFYHQPIKPYEYYIENNSISAELITISRKLNAPVFEFHGSGFGDTITHGDQIDTTKCKVPVLSEVGFASIYSAEKIFQDIAYFIGNIMSVSADIIPPVVIDNDLRIEGHGFDLKQSFRHRK
jgi:hypothetical protein